MQPTERVKKIAENYKQVTDLDLIVVDASKFQTQLTSLAVTMTNLLEREAHKLRPHLFMHDDFAMILRQMRHTCDLLINLNAEDKIDTDGYRQAYGFVALPLIRSVIDGFYNITSILDDPTKARLYRASGYRQTLDASELDRQRYGSDTRFVRQAELTYKTLSTDWRRCGFEEAEIRGSDLWPTLSLYLRMSPKNTRHKALVRTLTLGFWREYSSISHLSFDGIRSIAPYISADIIPREYRENFESAGHRTITMHLARAHSIMLATITELQSFYGFKDANVNTRISTLWDVLTVLPEIRELYEIRYRKLHT